MTELAPISLRDANQQFSELVRRVEATGQGYQGNRIRSL